MKKTMSWCLGIFLILSAGLAGAQPRFSQNEFTTAESLDAGMTQAGINFTLGDHYKNYYPEVRYGLGAMMEVGVKLGVTSVSIDSSESVGALVGADFKYQLIKETEGVPIDLAVDFGVDTVIIHRSNATVTSFSTIISKGFPLTDRGYKFIPYGGLEMAVLRGSYEAINDNTSVNVFGGIEWKLSQKFMLLLELKAGPSMVGGAGIRFEY
ncbi:MAG: hypothetical protein M0R70_04115 [Nitrospirae bacterium]|nr:hypothetical protein [Nitrospirota bacterium]